MLYQKIGNNKYPIKKFSTFKTQFGKDAIRVIGDVPLADGFQIVDDSDNVIADASDYKFLYREDDTCKEYTKVAEEIVPTQSFSSGDVPVDPIQRQISALNRRINEITPWTTSKMGYVGESDKIFYDVPEGNTLVFFDNYNGNYSINREADRLTVSFDTLETETNITLSIQ